MLQVRELSVEVAGRLVVKDASFTIRAGDKAGLVGLNGAGKTSLLKVLSEQAPPAAGLVLCSGSLGYLPQNPRPRSGAGRAQGALNDVTALSHVLSGKSLDVAAATMEGTRLAMEADPTMDNVHAYSEAEEHFRNLGGYSAESEARRITAGLGLNPDRVDLSLGVLSGGERRRVEMARVLFSEPLVLLLDEPTNHLDVDAKTWLMSFLRNYRGALIVVSHDLELLDSAITRVLHLSSARLTEYRGTYSQYQKARKQEEARLGKLAERQQQEIQRLSLLAEVMRRQTAKRAKTAHSLDKRVERLRAEAVTPLAKERKAKKVRLPDPPHSGRLVLRANGLAKSYGGPAVFEDVSFELERGQRLLVMGLNGAGKTSLLRILAGESQADRGRFEFGHLVSPGYYAQEHEGIQSGRTVLSHMRELSDAPEPQLRSVLGMFGLSGDFGMQDAGTLSGGEKTKLALAQLVAGRHNLLLLDEPTNNLDPPSRTVIAEALAGWPGTMILVSHDPDFVQALRPQRMLVMPEGRVDYWDDELLDLVSMA